MIRTIEMYSVYVSVKANTVNAFVGTVWSRHVGGEKGGGVA